MDRFIHRPPTADRHRTMLWYSITLPLLACLLTWSWQERRWLWLVGASLYALITVPAGIVADPLAFVVSGTFAVALAATFVPWHVENRRRWGLFALRASGDYHRLRQLQPDAFERKVAAYMRVVGFERVEVVGGTSDGGVDVRAHDGTRPVVVQCKRYTGKKNVGVKDVREFLGCLSDHGYPRGIFATTASYTASAIDFAASNDIELWDGRDLAHRLAHLRTDEPVPLGDHLGTVRTRILAKIGRSPAPNRTPRPTPSSASVLPGTRPLEDSASDPHVVGPTKRPLLRTRRSTNRAVLDALASRGDSADQEPL